MSLNLTIAQSVKLRPIAEIAAELGLADDELELYGRYKAKINLSVLARPATRPPGKLILVTAMTPTAAGEGKTTVTIGLAQGLCQIGQRAISATREPAMGPVFGVKGGAAGGGHSQVLPMEDINLHFTGDFPAITQAHNLLAALVDNHLQYGNAVGLDVRSILWKRVIDVNDRTLRQVVVGLGGKGNGWPRESGFVITPASEVMAILCLSKSRGELKERLGRIVVGTTAQGDPVQAAALKAAGAMAVILKEAIKPNLVQT
ncbi:MAG: formate--tetrahydrofolate ligase, partial [Candidatus Xenobia bacterium]